MIQKLLELGLTRNEAHVYLSLVKNGECKAGEIASITKLQRSSCYDTLKSLMNKGLVSTITKININFYIAAPPNQLLANIKEKERLAREIVPELKNYYKARKKGSAVQVYKGIKGVKTAMVDIIKTKKTNRIFGLENQLGEYLPTFEGQFVRMLKEENIQIKELTRQGKNSKSSSDKQVKFVGQNVKSNITTNIYGDKISIIVWGDEPEAIIIENHDAARSYKNYFEFMWENADSKKD